jgi:signal transduction histidine kinase
VGACTLINSAAETVRRSRNKLKAANHGLALQAEILRSFNEQLEQRVQERTAELKRAEECAHKLGAQVLRLQDEERRRIARDLHDSVGQSVAILNMNLGRLSRSASLSRGEAALVVDSKAIAQDVSDEVRTISYLLHPPLLDEMGLPSALRWYVGGFTKRTGIATHLDLSQNFSRLPADLEIAIFRIVQEALTNIHRHSGSSRATVRVTWGASNVALEIADQGRGIPIEKQRAFESGGAMGVGISGMRERVGQLGGRLDLHSSARGTIVSASFPLREAAQPAPGNNTVPVAAPVSA